MKAKRLSDWQVKMLMSSFTKRERRVDAFYEALSNVASLRRALRKVDAIMAQVYFDCGGPAWNKAQKIIDKALGVKR